MEVYQYEQMGEIHAIIPPLLGSLLSSQSYFTFIYFLRFYWITFSFFLLEVENIYLFNLK